jgi:ABC-type nitrate/sulfonate/bicarbonate transport system substrate-binding protein
MLFHRRCFVAIWSLLQSLVFVAAGYAASALDSLTIGYSSFSGHYVPLWIAVDDRLGKKYGLDLKAVYAGRARPQQLLISGETPLVVATGTGALTSHVLGVKDQVIVLVFVNKVPGVIVARPEIKNAEDLRGKVIGTGRPGALADTMVRYVLRSKLNLIPDRDVRLLPVGEPALALQSMERGVVDAASFSGPQALMAKKMGFHELVNYEKVGIVYPYNTVTTLRQTVAKNPELIERVLKTLIEGIAIFRTNKQKSIAVWRKYLRGASDDVLEESYQATLGELERTPMPSLQVIKSGLDVLSLEYPQAKQTDPALIIDASIMRRIEQSGFVDSLYKK